MILGVLLGLGAATSQSLSYIFSRTFSAKHEKSTLPLLAMSHIMMGVMAGVLVPFFWPERFPPAGVYLRPLLGASFYYLAGQAGLFLALKRTVASRIAPLLGLKILILALIAVAWYGQVFTVAQWGAVLMSVSAAFLLNRSGGSIPWQSLAWILFTCFGYVLSDLEIKNMMDAFSYMGLFNATIFCTSASYVLCGAASLGLLPFLEQKDWRTWAGAAPFSLAWFLAMFFLYGCFAVIGVVFGNIVQSTRGVISIFLGMGIARMGFLHLEDHVPRAILLRRIAAALMMTAAIALFYTSRA
jgi:drug/metabolite transporter (DMT)-like permease